MALTGRDWLALGAFMLACALTSGLGGVATATSVNSWYQTLTKPAFNPPDWLFAPVWTVIFILIALAGWRVWRRRHAPGGTLALGLYALQLLLNVLWSVLFFGARAPAAALVEIILLLTVVLIVLELFRRLDTLAALLFLPYPLWVGFATVLNAAIVVLN
ncbi:tryptophan-rich sensory protein [Ectothiorhodospiraceae bacterium WFHF3C12]|nr:tryptophan-rich sensory protein [Ectothiorhodospiraceae bacterium WFHF3C12]